MLKAASKGDAEVFLVARTDTKSLDTAFHEIWKTIAVSEIENTGAACWPNCTPLAKLRAVPVSWASEPAAGAEMAVSCGVVGISSVSVAVGR